MSPTSVVNAVIAGINVWLFFVDHSSAHLGIATTWALFSIIGSGEAREP